MSKISIASPLWLALIAAGLCFAQAEPGKGAAAPDGREGRYYSLEFVVKEVEDSKALNARSYSMTVSTGEKAPPAQIRSGSRFPIATGPGSLQHVDVGVNIDCREVRHVSSTPDKPGESRGRIALVVGAEVSNVLAETAPRENSALPPVVRQIRWNGEVVVPVGKPTIIFSSDDVASTRKMQLELTATPIE